MFGRATIRLGIGPHSSCILFGHLLYANFENEPQKTLLKQQKETGKKLVYSVYCLCSYRLLQHDLSIVYCREFLVSSSNCICNVLGVFSYLRQSSCCSAIAVIHDISLPQSHSNITTSNIGNVIRTSTFVYGLFVS